MMRRGASPPLRHAGSTATLCVAVSQTTATAAPSSALYEWPQSRDALLAAPPPPPLAALFPLATNSRQRKEIKCTSFMRELGSYFHPLPPPFLPFLATGVAAPLCLSRSCSSPLSLSLFFSVSLSLLSLSTQCANNGSALLTQKVALWRQCSSSLPRTTHFLSLLLLLSFPFAPPPPPWQHLDWFIAHSLQRRLVQSAPAKWSEGGKHRGE